MKILKINKNGTMVEREMDLNNTVVTSHPDKLSLFLANEIELEEGIKFETIISLLYKEKDFFNILFHQELNGTTIENIKKQMDTKENNHITEEEKEISFLEISKMFELVSFEKGNTIDLYTVLMGVGKEKKEDESIEEFYVPVSMSSLSILKKYNIKIQKIVSIYRENITEEYQEPIIIAGSSITVYELLQAILYEVCYYNNNQKKKEAYNKQDIEFNFDDRIFELETTLKVLVKNEEYEKASQIKKELDELKKKQE